MKTAIEQYLKARIDARGALEINNIFYAANRVLHANRIIDDLEREIALLEV